MATAAISEGMAEKLRPKVAAMVEAGRERAKIRADADECRAKVQGAKPGPAVAGCTAFRFWLRSAASRTRSAENHKHELVITGIRP
eukprot:COSAG03_NODE_20886_length_312_cov_0.727700_1_plen_85_part_01